MKVAHYTGRLTKAGRIPSGIEITILSLLKETEGKNDKVKKQSQKRADRQEAYKLIQTLPKAIKTIYIN